MYLEQLYIKNLRIISEAELSPGENINLIYGKNGSGKTTILEAIHILSRAKSFRTPRVIDVIRRDTDALQVVGSLSNQSGLKENIGIEKSRKLTLLKHQQQIIKTASEQARNLPLLVLSPDSHELLHGSPKERRKWLDWFVFHVEQDYLSEWKLFHSALRQRNQLLRHGAANKEFDAWELLMEKHGRNLTEVCSRTIKKLDSLFKVEAAGLLPEATSLEYVSGWNLGQEYIQILQDSRNRDRERGFTSSGPHRAEVNFRHDEISASKTLSRGQSKLYLTALLLAQLRFVKEKGGVSPVILIDDVAAELDEDSQQHVSRMLSESGAQSFLTTTDANIFSGYTESVFHVEHGKVKKMIQ